MTDDTTEIDRTTALASVWIIAGIAAALFVVMMIFFGDFGYTGPVFLGLIIWGVLGFVLMKGLVDLPDPPKQGAFDMKGVQDKQPTASRRKTAAEKKLADSAAAAKQAVGKAARDAGALVREKAQAVKKSATDTAESAKSTVDEKAHAAKAAATGANADEPGKPKLLSAAREGKPDDLKDIKGVGPKLEQTLHEMGVYHFDQIASWSEAEVAWVDENLEGFKGRVSRDDWIAQAKILAAGGETEFSKRT